jgi:hypothetical protein
MSSRVLKSSVTPVMSRGALAVAALGVATAVSAAPWEFNPRVEAGYLYDDNYRLALPGAEQPVDGPMADAELEMRTLTQTGEFSFAPRVRATYFSGAEELDSVDYYARFNWERRGQRVFTRLLGDYSLQDVVNSELPDVDSGGGLGDPDLGDSGRVLVDNRRQRFDIRPLMNIEVSERRELQFEAGYMDVSYERLIDDAQVDYRVASLATGLLTRLSPINSLTFRLRGARYDIERRDPSDGYGAEIQWDRQTSQETQMYVRAGAQQLDILTANEFGILAQDSKTAVVGGAGVNFLLGRNELFLDLSRAVGASSSGVLVARDQLRLRWTRAMTPRLSFLAGLRGTRDDQLDEASGFSSFTERSYATGDVGLQWRWQEEFSLRVVYDYTWQEFRDATEDATSSGAMVTVLYQPLQRRR